MNIGPVILCVDLPAELSAQVQLLARKLGVPSLLIQVGRGGDPVHSVPAVHYGPPAQATTLPNASVDSAVLVPVASDELFRLIEPDYDCENHEITFRSEGANGLIEFMAPGVTDWTTDPGPHVVDAPVVADGNPLTLFARLNRQLADVQYVFDFASYCQKRA